MLVTLIVIGVIAALLVGPERLPRYAESFARLVKKAGEYMRGAKDRMREEVGPEIDELDWRKLDPRQYDPRRIVREALMDDEPPARPGGRPARPRADRRPRPAITPVSAAPTASAAPPSLATVAGAGVAGAAAFLLSR